MSWIYLAGWFDGEGGCIHFVKQSQKPVLSLGNTDIKVMQQIQKLFHSHNMYCEITTDLRSVRLKNYKDFYRIVISKYTDVLRILTYMQPYLITKYDESVIAINIINQMGHRILRGKWTPEDNCKLTELWIEHRSVKSCVDIMGRSRPAIENQVERLQLRKMYPRK